MFLRRPLLPAWLSLLLLAVAVSLAAAQPPSLIWGDGNTRGAAWRADDEIAVSSPRADWAKVPAGELLFAGPALRVLRPAASDAEATRAALASGVAAPVYYASPDRRPGSRLVPTGLVIVRHREPDPAVQAEIEARHGLTRVDSPGYAPGLAVCAAPTPQAAVEAAMALARGEDVALAAPDWRRERFPRAVPDDPMFTSQWHLMNTGQGGGLAGNDVGGGELATLWDAWRGSTSEVVAIVDDSVQLGHPDLAPNVLPGLSWDYVDDDPDPSPAIGERHGTACAGVAVARGFNGLGVSGVAPEAGLVGYRLLAGATDVTEAAALARDPDVVDISSNSWGPTDDGTNLTAPGALAEAALEAGAAQGRGGKGRIYVWAGGNGGASSDNANYDGYANSRFTIAVAALGNTGRQSWYSEPGANIVVSAPSNGGTLGVATTDVTGTPGYSTSDYTTSFGGTSAACPLVAGACALILQANPNLGWRDVRDVLAETADLVDAGDADWALNGAGYHVSHKYGFGRVNVVRAVQAALSRVPAGPEVALSAAASPGLPIPDNGAAVASELSIPADLRVEHAEVHFDAADHPAWGDLEVVLTSPAGTRSVLSEVHVGGASAPGNRFEGWRFGSARHYGESSAGVWTLSVRDGAAGNTGSFQGWTLTLHARQASAARAALPFLPMVLMD